VNSINYEVPYFAALSTPHSHPSWAQISGSGSYTKKNLFFFILGQDAHYGFIASLPIRLHLEIIKKW
jgi:hypothetical protein